MTAFVKKRCTQQSHQWGPSFAGVFKPGAVIKYLALPVKLKTLLIIFFLMSTQSMASDSTEELWQRVNTERTDFFESHFGVLPDDILKIGHLTGVWPGGGIFQIQASKIGPDIWVYTTFGLSNPDMPTQVTVSDVSVESEDERLVETSGTLKKKENVPSYPGRPGYGYEIIMLADESAEWPLWFIQWAVNAEILHDADLLGRVKKYRGLTVEDIAVGENQYVNVLISSAGKTLPKAIPLSTGNAELLVATVITDDEMSWSMKNSRDALFNALEKADVSQVSSISRPSIFNPEPIDYSQVDSAEKARRLHEQGLLRKAYLFPLEFGGEDIAANVIYIPRAADNQKKAIEQEVMRLAQEGKIDNYSASPSYKGNSFVASSIRIEASGASNLEKTISIW